MTSSEDNVAAAAAEDEGSVPGADVHSVSGAVANQPDSSARSPQGSGVRGVDEPSLPNGPSTTRQLREFYALGNRRARRGSVLQWEEDDFEEGDGEERENGYPLVADLTQFRLQNRFRQSVDEVIEQEAFNQDVIDSLEELSIRVANGESGAEGEEPSGEADGASSGPRNGAASRQRAFNDFHQQPLLSASVNERLAAITSGSVAPSFVFGEDEAAELMAASGSSEVGGEAVGAEERSANAGGSFERPPSRRFRRSHTQTDHVANHPAYMSPPQQYPLHNAAAVGRSANDASGVGRNPAEACGALHERGDIWNNLSSSGCVSGAQPFMGWQATKSTLKDRFSFMYCNEILADVYFIVGRGDQRQRIPAHKFVLATGSAVFDAMFNGGFAQKQREGMEASASIPEIELPDVEPNAFLALLKFLYSDDVSIGPESVITTLYTAKKYAVPAMENACVDFLKRNLGADNAFMLLTQARLFDEPQLAALCLEIIDKNTHDSLNAEGFADIDLDTLCVVLKRDTLRVREAPLFLSVLRWSVEQCRRRGLPLNPENQRLVIGKALYLIRFPLMTIDEFAQYAAQSGVLLDREVVSLFLYFTVVPKPQIAFSDVSRCCVFGKEVVVSRFQRVEGRWGYSGTPDRIKFTVDRRIYVIGFGLYGSIHGPHDYQITIQILHCGTGKVLASNDTSFSCDGTVGTFRVLFKEPVEIAPCVTYIASACLKGPDSHYGTKGLRRIVHQSPSSGVVTFQFTYAAGNNNGTSVEDGQIPEIIFCTKIN